MRLQLSFCLSILHRSMHKCKQVGIFAFWNDFKLQYKAPECQSNHNHVQLEANQKLRFLKQSLSPTDNENFCLHPYLYSPCNSTSLIMLLRKNMLLVQWHARLTQNVSLEYLPSYWPCFCLSASPKSSNGFAGFCQSCVQVNVVVEA